MLVKMTPERREWLDSLKVGDVVKTVRNDRAYTCITRITVIKHGVIHVNDGTVSPYYSRVYGETVDTSTSAEHYITQVTNHEKLAYELQFLSWHLLSESLLESIWDQVKPSELD